MNRSTLILISILVVLGAIVFFLLPSEKERETSYTPGEVHFSIDSANCVKIEIQRPGKSVTMENIGGKWTITSPVRYIADPAAVNQLLSGCSKFKVGSLISSNPEKQKLFQVDSSGVRLTIADRSGKVSDIILGKMGPSFSDIYFRLPASNDVYLGQGIDSWSVSKEIKEWRDKTILNRPSENIKDLNYQVGTKQFSFHRDSSGWKSSTNTVDAGSMNTALNAISNLKADDFVDTAMKFSTPPLTIQIPGAESSTLQLSPSRPDSSKYFVQMPNTQTTFVISKWTAQQLMKPIEQHVTVPGHTLATSKHQQEVTPPITPAGKKSATAKKMTETKPVAQTSPKTTPPKKQPAKTSQDTVSSPPVTTSLPVTSTKPTPKTKPGSQPLNVTPTQGTDEEEGDLSVHTVTSGETMTSIAKKYNVTVEQILKWNLLKSISVKPGQELYIYQKKK